MARALAKRPTERFATVSEFAGALVSRDGAFPPELTDRSIAVLPFVNASPDPDNEYLSDGITEELINALANVPGLRVASRSSVLMLNLQTPRAIARRTWTSGRPEAP